MDLFESGAGAAAHARKNNPRTSKDAAATFDMAKIRTSQREVLQLFRIYGPMDDRALIEAARERGSAQSDSSIRTRRSELSKPNTDRVRAIVEEMGDGVELEMTEDEAEAHARSRLSLEGYRGPVYDTGKRVVYGTGRRGIVYDITEAAR